MYSGVSFDAASPLAGAPEGGGGGEVEEGVVCSSSRAAAEEDRKRRETPLKDASLRTHRKQALNCRTDGLTDAITTDGRMRWAWNQE